MSDIPEIKMKMLFEDAIVPEKAFPTDSGFDLFVYKFEKLYNFFSEVEVIPEEISEMVLSPGERILINTGIAATVGPGYEIQIRPRSGLALKNGLTVLNTPGTIDEAFRGMLGVIIINHSFVSQTITKKMKIAQMVVCPVVLCQIRIVTDLDETARSAGGFGHTGV
jgi:dUTP pyrophosphatase